MGLIPHGRLLLVQPWTRRFLPGRAHGRAVVRRSDPLDRDDLPGAPRVGPGAVGHLERLVGAVDGLLARRGSRVSLLEIRLVPEEATIRHGYEEEMRAWHDGVFTAMTSGSALDDTIPETIEATPARRALYAVLDVLRYEEDLHLLRDAWPRIRKEIRSYVLGLVRDDDPDDMKALHQALSACGVRPLVKPEPRAAAAGLRAVLRALVDTPQTHRERVLLRQGLSSVRMRALTPRHGRYLLARFLAEREGIVAGTVPDERDAEARAHLEDPHPERPPRFPAELAGPALHLLAALDMSEARVHPDDPWSGHSAYNVLRLVAAEARWSPELRSLMDGVLDGVLPTDDELLRFAKNAVEHAHPTLLLRRPGPGEGDAAHPLVLLCHEDGPPRCSETQQIASQTLSLTVLRVLGQEARSREASSVIGPGQWIPGRHQAAAVCDTVVLGSGDGTETSQGLFPAGPSEISSPGGPAAAEDGRQAPSRNPLEGGDGTETSIGLIHAGRAEVVSPGGRAAAPVRLFAFKESLETGMGAPREGGWVQGILLRPDEPPKDLRVSRQQYDAMIVLAKEKVVMFPVGAAGRKARDRLRRTLSSWGVRVAGGQVKSQTPRQLGERPTLLRLKGPFTVHLTDGIADRDGTARRLVREAERDAYLGQY